MQKIPLMLVKPGMIIAKDVYRNDIPAGIPVFGKDTVLTEALIDRLENMNIMSVYVAGHPVWLVGDVSQEEMLQQLDKRFSKVINDPLMKRLHEIYANHIKRIMGDDLDRQPE